MPLSLGSKSMLSSMVLNSDFILISESPARRSD